MRKFIYTSSNFVYQLYLRYTDDGILCFMELKPLVEIKPVLHRRILNFIPETIEDLEKFRKEAPGQLHEIIEEVTFTMWWDAYGKKVNRLRAEKLWNKLKEGERVLCYTSVTSYNRLLDRTGRYKMDPETYLSSRGWETNWNEIR